MLAHFLVLLAAAVAADSLTGNWDANMVSNGIRVPFRMEVRAEPARVCFFEGSEPVCSTSAKVEAGKLSAQWDFLNTKIELTAAGESLAGGYGSLRGSRVSEVHAIRQRAAPPPSEPPAQIGGRWEIHSNERPNISWQLLLEQSGSDIKGTILRVDGDTGLLTGRVDGKSFTMSHFAGDRPTLVEGKLLPDGTLDLTIGKNRGYALRPDAARSRGLQPPEDPETYAGARDPKEVFRFRAPDLSGRTFTEEYFAGRPYIVSITGSWCPNCRDEAPFLADVYRQYGPQGLGIIGLCFENQDDPTYQALRAFVRKYGISYPMVIAGDPGKLKDVVPQVENAGAFPTTIFIGSDGRIRLVHTGFPSAASGPERTWAEKEFRATIETLLEEAGGD